jgi:cytochrome c oxidase subunit 4
MSTAPHQTPADDTLAPDPMKYSKDLDSTPTLLIVFAAVIGLTFVSVGLSSLGLGRLSLPIQLLIGTIQAALVGYHFMHLKQGDRVVILTALASVFWMGILFVLFMADYMTRRMIVGW